MKTPKATTQTIAQATGLSLATVSRALAGSDQVLPTTRARVLEAAKALHFVRDRAAVRLKTGKTQVLAFLVNRSDANQPAFKDLMLGISDAMQDTDYHLIVMPDGPDGNRLKSLRYVVENKLADGVVITHTTPDDERVRYLQESELPFVTHGRTLRLPAHAFVDFANERYASDAVHALHGQGRRRLALLLPEAGGTFCSYLSSGFEEACKSFKLEGVVIKDIDLDQSPEKIYQWTRKHARSFDGLVLTREAPVIALTTAVLDSGLRLQADLDLVVKYSSHLPRYLRQPLLGCFEDVYLTGISLGQSLLRQMTSSGDETLQTLFQPPRIERLYEPDSR
jgi:LacI family transcriptional regulator